MLGSYWIGSVCATCNCCASDCAHGAKHRAQLVENVTLVCIDDDQSWAIVPCANIRACPIAQVESFTPCNYGFEGRCRYGNLCRFPHSPAELAYFNARFSFRKYVDPVERVRGNILPLGLFPARDDAKRERKRGSPRRAVPFAPSTHSHADPDCRKVVMSSRDSVTSTGSSAASSAPEFSPELESVIVNSVLDALEKSNLVSPPQFEAILEQHPQTREEYPNPQSFVERHSHLFVLSPSHDIAANVDSDYGCSPVSSSSSLRSLSRPTTTATATATATTTHPSPPLPSSAASAGTTLSPVPTTTTTTAAVALAELDPAVASIVLGSTASTTTTTAAAAATTNGDNNSLIIVVDEEHCKQMHDELYRCALCAIDLVGSELDSTLVLVALPSHCYLLNRATPLGYRQLAQCLMLAETIIVRSSLVQTALQKHSPAATGKVFVIATAYDSLTEINPSAAASTLLPPPERLCQPILLSSSPNEWLRRVTLDPQPIVAHIRRIWASHELFMLAFSRAVCRRHLQQEQLMPADEPKTSRDLFQSLIDLLQHEPDQKNKSVTELARDILVPLREQLTNE